MKHRTLNIVAYSLFIMGWVVLVGGVAASIILGVKAATPSARLIFLAGGLAATALNTLLLLGSSKLIYLFINIDSNLEDIQASLKRIDFKP